MYYPYGGAQQQQQLLDQQQQNYYYYPQGQQEQAGVPPTSWQQYTNPQHGGAPPAAPAGAMHNGVQLPGQYHDPYVSATPNGVQSYSNYYPTPNYPQQQQQQQPLPPPPPAPQMHPQQPQLPQQQVQQYPHQDATTTTTDATTTNNAAASASLISSTGAIPFANSQTDASGMQLPTQQHAYQAQQRQQTGAFPSGNYPRQQEQCNSVVGRCARPPPRRSVDLKSAPNPRRDISQKPGNQEIQTSSGQLPLSATGFLAVDDGNASPKFFRPTTNSVPAEERLVKDSKIFFGAVLAPLCRPLYPREEVPLVEGRPPVRCFRCRAYISCHARFVDMGRCWVCPFCNMANEVENEYFCNLDARNQRLDRAERPELSRGSVEYDVGPYPDYALRDEKDAPIPARPLHYLFLLDVSQKAVSSFLPDYVDALMHSLHEMAQQYPQCRVAFITYASTLQFYNVRHPRMPQLIVADVDNPFVPLPFTSLCWLTLGTELDLVDTFLMRLMEYAQDLRETDSVMGAAVHAATLVLAGQHGGHVILCGHKAPQRGIGALKLREQHLLYGTDKEKDLLRPIEGFWRTTATACAKQQISFDLHMFADQYCELVTISQPCHLSNGRVHLFSNYDRETDATKVQAVMNQALLEEAGYAGILRVRCSSGVRVQAYHGHFMSQDSHDMDLAHVQGSSTFFVEFAHEGKLEKTSYAYFQTALLYTTRGGERRVRVHSVRMSVVTTLSGVFEADLEATLMGYIHEAIGNAVNKGLQYARSTAQDRVLKMLIAYRRVCTSNATSSLLMPSRLRLIPLFVLSFMKADALVEGTTVPIDDRVQKLFLLMTIPMHQCVTYLYPTLYAVHHLLSEPTSGVIDPETGHCVLPGWQQLIFDSITTDGVYVLCDEQARIVYLWIGSSVVPEVSLELFGTTNALDVGRTVFFENFGERLKNVLYTCLMRDDGMRRFVILHEKDRGEEAFFRQFKEENEGGSMGYDQLLVHLHREVKKSIE
ncbi:putative protein transport protein Sec24C [Trypanosoma cruzi]|uniref:Protein transport protein Sec24C n=2 Tax=Trypanosoma cruzi TaxID=5693 RepID=A0A2V2WC04_TRYCR|nr:putative protein transport protein Sec24C [Trypanosoma cruzi]